MKTYVITVATFKECIRQPLFLVLLLVAGGLLLVSPFVPYYTFGEDIKMVKDTGLATVLIAALFLALVSSSTSISEEIEGRTAITLLSKPITRRQFIVGKLLGVLAAVAVLFVVLGVIFALTIYYKVEYDAREASGLAPPSAERWAEVWQIAPGLVLSFFEVAVLSAISVAISTRVPMLVNLVVCLALFVLGHLAPVIVRVTEGRFELVAFMARLFATILPALEAFNVKAAVATNTPIPWGGYVAWAFVYCVIYCTIALLLAFILFEDRDLA